MEGHSLRLFWKGNFKKGKLVGHFRKGRKGTVHKLEFICNLGRHLRRRNGMIMIIKLPIHTSVYRAPSAVLPLTFSLPPVSRKKSFNQMSNRLVLSAGTHEENGQFGDLTFSDERIQFQMMWREEPRWKWFVLLERWRRLREGVKKLFFWRSLPNVFTHPPTPGFAFPRFNEEGFF